MKLDELRNKSAVELEADLVELLKTRFGLRMQHAAGQLGDVSQLNKLRRDIARIKTIMSQKV